MGFFFLFIILYTLYSDCISVSTRYTVYMVYATYPICFERYLLERFQDVIMKEVALMWDICKRLGCNIMVKGEYISEIYRWYEDSLLTVNRRYQRKLVWSLEEKRQFINTIMHDYPVPLFLVVNSKETLDGIDYPRKEIIDGLQRIEAIISFIKNEYNVKIGDKYYYFNLDVFPGNGVLIRDGLLEQKPPVLDFEKCRQFLLYQLPVTTIDANTSTVEDIFKRINSTGRKLSLQDLRQAGVTGYFSNLVRQTATKIRGDYSENDIVKLSEMASISLNSSGLGYGIDINNVFWIKHGIITEDGLRRSKDEEIIANLYNCILSNYTAGMSSKSLDKLYNENSKIYEENEKRLANGFADDLKNTFLAVIDDLIRIFETKQATFSQLLFTHERVYNKDLVFIIVFLAFIQLRNEHYIIEDYVKMGGLLRNLADNELQEIISASDSKWNAETRNRLVERIKQRLIKGMVFKETEPEWKSELISLLKRANVEEQMFDFKIGFHNLRSGECNNGVIAKSIKTLTAMAYTCPGKDGYVIIGISDKEDDAKDFEKYYGVVATKYNNYFVTGIKEEAIKYYGSIQKYIDAIKVIVEKEDIRQEVLYDILTTISTVNYGAYTLLVLKLSTNKPLFYGKDLYVRYQSNNRAIEPGSDEYYKLMDKFQTMSESRK